MSDEALAITASCLNPPDTAMIKSMPVYTRIATCGVAKRGCTFARDAGSKPSLAPANRILGIDNTAPLKEPRMDNIVTTIIKIIPGLPRAMPATAANGAFLLSHSQLHRKLDALTEVFSQ